MCTKSLALLLLAPCLCLLLLLFLFLHGPCLRTQGRFGRLLGPLQRLSPPQDYLFDGSVDWVLLLGRLGIKKGKDCSEFRRQLIQV